MLLLKIFYVVPQKLIAWVPSVIYHREQNQRRISIAFSYYLLLCRNSPWMCQFINYLVQEWWNIQNSDMQQHYTLKALLQNLLECSICRFWKCIVRVANTGSGELLSAHDKIKVTFRIWRRWNLLSAMFLSLWTCFKSFFSSFRGVGVDERSPNGAQIHNVWMWCKYSYSAELSHILLQKLGEAGEEHHLWRLRHEPPEPEV